MVERKLLIETVPMIMEMVESEDKPGRIYFRGRVGMVDEATMNKRRYAGRIARRELNKLQPRIESRGLLGELDHPDDGRTRLTRVSHVINFWDLSGNELISEFEPLPTPNGRILEALGRAGIPVGASIRGFGSTRWNKEDGVEDVGDDYQLQTFDIVYDPAAAGAYPRFVSEAIEAAKQAEEMMDLATLKNDNPQLYAELTEAAQAEVKTAVLMEVTSMQEAQTAAAVSEAEAKLEAKLRAEFSAGVRHAVEEVADEAKRHARSEALSDPALALARPVVEQIAQLVAPWSHDAAVREVIEAKDAEIQRLQAESATNRLKAEAAEKLAEERTALAREAGLHVVLERSLRGESDEGRTTIIEALGPVAGFESQEALEERVGAMRKLRGEPAQHVAPATVTEAVPDQREEVARLTEELSQAKAKQTELAEIAEKALNAADRAAVESYAAGVASRHPLGELVVQVCGNAQTIDEAKVLVQKLDEGRKQPGRANNSELTEKIRRRLSRGKERDIQEDTEGPAEEAPRHQVALPAIPGLDFDEVNRNVRRQFVG